MTKENFTKEFKVGDMVTSVTWEIMGTKYSKARIVAISNYSDEICLEDEDGLTIISYLSYNLKKVKDG